MGIFVFSSGETKAILVEKFWLDGENDEGGACIKARRLDRDTDEALLEQLIKLIDTAPKIKRNQKYILVAPVAEKFFLTVSNGQKTDRVQIMDPLIHIWTNNKERVRWVNDELYRFLEKLIEPQPIKRMDVNEFFENHAVMWEPQLA